MAVYTHATSAIVFCTLACMSAPDTALRRLDPQDQQTCITWQATAREAHKEAVLRRCVQQFEHLYEVRR